MKKEDCIELANQYRRAARCAVNLANAKASNDDAVEDLQVALMPFKQTLEDRVELEVVVLIEGEKPFIVTNRGGTLFCGDVEVHLGVRTLTAPRGAENKSPGRTRPGTGA